MNHIYQIVFNRSQQCYQAVAETATSQGKTKASKLATSGHVENKPNAAANLAKPTSLAKPILLKPIAFSVLLAFSAQLFSGIAMAEPTGGQVTAGAGTINQAGTVTTINQATQNMAIDWHTFNVRANEAVNFNQPNANAIALNRVTGTESSNIMGSLTANGRVFILNPNGVLFGAGAQVNVGSLVASTASLSNANFMAGNFNFTGNGNNASIVNNANINIAQGGTLAFIAPVIKNNGTIIVNQSVASQGSVILAAADDVTLTLQNGGLTSYTLNKGSVQTLIDNGGLIQADGGHVVLTAKGLDALSQSAINHTGIIEAQTVSSINGKIELLGDMQIGTLNVSGKLDASAPASKNPNGGDGGFVETSAAKVNLLKGNQVFLSKGGKWLIDPIDMVINDASGIESALEGGYVGVDTFVVGTESAPYAGNVYINDEINWTSSNELFIRAHNDIYINKDITATNGKLILHYGQGTLHGENSNYYLKGASVKLPEGFGNFETKKGLNGIATKYQVITRLGVEGDISAHTLQGLAQSANYVLGADIDAAVTNAWNSGEGFEPIGNFDSSGGGFVGKFDGLGNKVSNLYINRPFSNFVGLFGYVNAALIQNVKLVNANITGGSAVGGLVGYNGNGSTVAYSHTTGTVSGLEYVGGLAGNNSTSSYITSSYSQANVSGVLSVGGFCGSNTASIFESYSEGDVTGAFQVGGFVGSTAYNAIGFSPGVVSSSYSTGGVFGTSNLPRYNELIEKYGINISFIRAVGGFVGDMGSPVVDSYSIGLVRTSSPALNNSAGGFSGSATASSTATYWDVQASDSPSSLSGSGKTTAQMQQQATYAGWDFDNVWRINEGSSYPVLRALTQGTIVIDPNLIGVIAPNVAKVYDGIGVNAVHDLAALTGWDGGAFAEGLIGTDSLTDTSIFSGSLTYDGTWLGARNAGEYSIIPTGLSSQKYDIQFIPGTLYIVPRVLDVAVTKTVDGNATFNTGYRIINNSAIAGEIVNVTGSATVASANTGVYNSFASNNLVTDNPNYTANPVDTDYYEYTGTGQVVATIKTVNTTPVEPIEPVKEGLGAQLLSASPNNPITTVNTATTSLNNSARFISASLDEPPKMVVMSYVSSANALDAQYANASIGGNTAFSGPNSAFSGVGVKVKGNIGRSVANNIPDLYSYTKAQGVDFVFDKGIGLVISSGFATFFSGETSLKLAKFFGQETANRFTTASKTVADKFINELKKRPNLMELSTDFVIGLFVDAAKTGVKEELGATGYGAGEYAVDAFAAIVDASLGSILDPKMNPIQAKIKFQVDLTIQLGILTTRQVIRTGSAFNQINKQEKANAVSMADSIIQSASYLQAGNLTRAKQQIQTNLIAEGHGLMSQFTYGIDSKFAEALVLKSKGDMQGANQLIRQAMLEANSLDNSQGTHNGNSSFWDWSGTTSYSGYSSKMGALLGFTVPTVPQGGFSGAGSTSNNGR